MSRLSRAISCFFFMFSFLGAIASASLLLDNTQTIISVHTVWFLFLLCIAGVIAGAIRILKR